MGIVRKHWVMGLGLSAVCMILLSGPQAIACNWDTETLLQERSRFPTALEIILGKFPRHTRAYYQWRLNDRLQKLEKAPGDNLLLDDVAVSYEKLGRYAEAIDVAKKQLGKNPDRYESLANLGTFYIHDGQYKEGLVYIEKAIDMNPDAHFGREKYQAILVEYVVSRMSEDVVTLPLAQERFQEGQEHKVPFRTFLEKKLLAETEADYLQPDQFDEAAKGILGMMRFSRHQSPILLEVFGELSQASGAPQIAYRAYKSASEHVEDEQVKRQYEVLASRALNWSLRSWEHANNVKVSEAEIAEDFRIEKADAAVWFAELERDERDWIAAGEAVDVKFNQKYREIPDAVSTDRDTEPRRVVRKVDYRTLTPLVGAACGITLALIFVWNRRRNQSTR